MLKGKTVVLGITGSIAAYKAAELTSSLKKLGVNVRVIMTKNAQHFVMPLTFQSLSQNPVATDMFKAPERWDIEHISLANAADVMVIAPASANVIGKLASGIADDILTTTAFATTAPIIIAPAMNNNMYNHAAVCDNIKKLKERGCIFVEPAVGRLACGVNAKGKLAPIDVIVEYIEKVLTKKDLKGKNILVTAGPTCESIDAVRYITNHSSGKMGYALAKAAKDRGASVTLISGMVALNPPTEIDFIQVTSAAQMHEAVKERAAKQDVIIKAAAVADYRPVQACKRKIKKGSDMDLKLIENPDILKELGQEKRYVLVGFCMETEDLIKNAKKKLKDKNLDLIVANDLTTEGAGFNTDTNIVTLLTPDGKQEQLPIMSKLNLAHEILDRITEIKQ